MGTVAISRAEVIAALAKAVRVGALSMNDAKPLPAPSEPPKKTAGQSDITHPLVGRHPASVPWPLDARPCDVAPPSQ